MRQLVLITVFSIVMYNCKSQQYTFDDLPETQLVFGRGGGITGEVNTYTILENGQVFHSNSLTNVSQEIKGMSKKEAVSHFKGLRALELSDMNFDHPGNMYYFLEEVNGENRYRVTWGSNDHQISNDCKKFYQALRTAIK